MTGPQSGIDGWSPPSVAERRRLLASIRTVAMVGVSANPARPSNFVATYLLGTDFEVYFVNPTVDEVLGRPCAPSLADLPVVPDCVDVFRRLEDVPAVADEAVAVGHASSGRSSDCGVLRQPGRCSTPAWTSSWTAASRSSTPASTVGCTWPGSTPASSTPAEVEPVRRSVVQWGSQTTNGMSRSVRTW